VAFDGQRLLSDHGLATGRFRKKLLRITPRGVCLTSGGAAFKLAHDDPANTIRAGSCSMPDHRGRHRDRAVRLVDLEAGAVHWLVIAVRRLLGARYVHFFCMSAIVAFLVVHVALALLVPKACAP